MNRRAALLAAAALIYAGSIMIGMSAQGWLGLAAIWALLLLYTVLMRPASQWSGRGLEGAIRLVSTLAGTAALSGILWLAGMGLSLMAETVPVWPGVALAGAGMVLARGVWSARKEAQMDAFLDEALWQLQGVQEPAAANGVQLATADDDLRWSRLSAVVSQVEPALSPARARQLAATLAPDLDRGFYREAMRDLSELSGAGAVRVQLALMARREVMPGWDDAPTAVSLLGRALDLDAETAAQACAVADARLSEPGADLTEAAALQAGLDVRLAALSPNDPLRAPLERVLSRLRRERHG
ncbi:MAG: Protein of unknown function (DUF826) [Rhodobacteraceae bacterium HLUCCA12]|nr:MAG: Protein of unknown function (DUF826) [Rhodobacteraceae bacterium HLUCCA12]